jgi:hypothetical protein
MLDTVINFVVYSFAAAIMALLAWTLYMFVQSSKIERTNYKETCEQIGGAVVWNGKFYECFTKGPR